MKKRGALLITGLLTVISAAAQTMGVKTNFVGDALLSPNISVEFGLDTHWTLDASYQANFWDLGGSKWKHWALQPEARYWFCERFAGHFIGAHAIGGEYNFGGIRNNFHFMGNDFSVLTDRRYQGWAAGAGLAYGYARVLGIHWNLEAELGIGWIYTRYGAYPCAECGDPIELGTPYNYFGLTKLALNLVYLF